VRLHETTPENYPVTEATIARARFDASVEQDRVVCPPHWRLWGDGVMRFANPLW
jgi:hypothetical protein